MVLVFPVFCVVFFICFPHCFGNWCVICGILNNSKAFEASGFEGSGFEVWGVSNL